MHVNNINLYLWNKPLPTSTEFSLLSPRERLEVLVWLGHLAPSSHNTQPWRFFCDAENSCLIVLLARHIVLPISDVRGRQAVISVGCAIENISVAARAYGLTCEIHYPPVVKEVVAPKEKNEVKGHELIPLATIRFSEALPDEVSLSLLPAILRRMSMRAEFDPSRDISKKVLARLNEALNTDGVEIHTISDSLRRLSISEFQGQADGYVLNSPEFAKELGDWLLPNNTESAVGMPGNTFGFDDAQSRRIHEGLRGQTPLDPEDMLRFSLGGKLGFEKSPVVAFVTTQNDEVHDWLNAGRAIERAFLILESEGVSYAVHAAIVEVRLINRIFAATLGSTNPLAAVFRIGYPKDSTIKDERPHSPRQPIDAVLVDSIP